MSPRQPNILWIVTTQWRASAAGYAGDVNARTPNLDALAAESVNYTQAVTPHPFGPFARAAMLTGVLSPENGVVDYFDPLPASARTVAHEMKEKGYATAFFGKWHLAKRDPAAPLVGEAHAKMIVPPEARGGFEFWEGFESGFLLNDPWLHGTRLAEPVQVKGYQSDVVCERARDWCGSGFTPDMLGVNPNPQRPWFCIVSLEAPHPPYDAPAAGVKAREPGEIVLPANVRLGGEVEAKARKELAGYYAHIEATDRAIGRLWRQVTSDKGQVTSDGTARETIVVFTSVHGDMHGAHGLFRKGWPHEESVRVPLLIRTPGVKPRRDDAAVSLQHLARLTLGADASRVSQARISMPSVVALPHQCDRVWRGVRTKTRKLLLNADDSPWLLFDLENDPLEMKNLAGDPARAGEIKELRAMM
jgi:arylsulfatase A-like enzyme